MTVHIVSFDVPYPPNYGGIIDVYNRIKALHAAGVQIILHCFEYGRGQANELNDLCEKVYYYPRKSALSAFGFLPYIAASRFNKKLLERLCADKYPILLEGIHTCIYLRYKAVAGKNVIVRCHNIEHDYYFQLAKASSNFFKKMFYRVEGYRLKNFEKVMHKASSLAAVSAADVAWLCKSFKNVHYIPPFHPFNRIDIKAGMGKYILYHGNLSVEENRAAAEFLINKVFPHLAVPCIVAGRNAKNLGSLLGPVSHITLVEPVDNTEMHKLVQNAQINILPTFQDTGIKLKLLHALFAGRHCIINPEMLGNTALSSTCAIAKSSQEFIQFCHLLFKTQFSAEDISKRKLILEREYNIGCQLQDFINLLEN